MSAPSFKERMQALARQLGVPVRERPGGAVEVGTIIAASWRYVTEHDVRRAARDQRDQRDQRDRNRD